MSALAWEPAGTPVPVHRPHLVVLPGGARGSAPAGPIRLTRRGRLALFLATLLAATALGVALLGPAGAAPASRTVTVAPGQTLSEIAATELPGLSTDRAIVAIQVANRLTSAQVHSGQRLVVPSS